MSDPVLAYLRGYGGLEHPTLEAAFAAEPARTMELLRGLAHQDAGPFTDAFLARVERRFDADPEAFFWILHVVAEKEPARARGLMDAWARLWGRAPKAAMGAFYYACANNAHLARPDLVRFVADSIPEDACRAFLIFQQLLVRRPELVGREAVQAVVRHLALQVNQAFYFIREVLRRRPDLTPLCTVALFEAALLESHPAVRADMLEDLRTVATHSHVQSELEKALRSPVRGASVAARALMGLLFRQKTRNQQRVLIDAVGLAARWPPLWEHLVFLLGTADPKTASAAAAAEFLEGVYRLHHLVDPHPFGEILVKRLEMDDGPSPPLPADVAFLASDAELAALWRRVATLAGRFGAPLRLRPLERWRKRPQALEAERQVLARAETTRRRKRRASLEDQIAALQKGPDPRSARTLAKHMKDALRAEAVEITRRAIETASMDAYRAAVRRVLGRDFDLSAVDPHVLPAFLYIERLGHMRNNRRYLTRLIEDRLEGRPHDWMRTEPAVEAWAARVRAVSPAIRLERWRAAFARDYAYAPKEVERERRRRLDRDLEQTRALFASLRVDGLESADAAALTAAFEKLKTLPPKDTPPPDPRVVEEIGLNLERIRLTEKAAVSDFEGRLRLEIETDPFQVLFMGEYGFASCLSLRGSNVWSAVSNAIDIDKAVVWARDPAGNIVGRRLLALVPEGIVSFRTYTNRHGLALDGFFERFLEEYAAHCGTRIVHRVSSGPLLSDAWYDDGAI